MNVQIPEKIRLVLGQNLVCCLRSYYRNIKITRGTVSAYFQRISEKLLGCASGDIQAVHTFMSRVVSGTKRIGKNYFIISWHHFTPWAPPSIIAKDSWQP